MRPEAEQTRRRSVSAQRQRIAWLALLVITGALSSVNCRAGGEKPQRTRVRVAIPASPITYLPVYLAHDLGFDSEQGIEILTEDVPGGSKAMQALFGGSVDVAASFYELAVQLTAEGRSVQSFLILLDRPGYVLAASPTSSRKMELLNDLRGAVVGVSTPGSASHNFLNYVLLTHNLSPKDVSVTSIGLGAGAEAALERGKVDAAVLTGSAVTVLQRRSPKVKLLVDTRTADGVRELYGQEIYPSHDLIAPTKWIRENALTARKVTAAVKKALDWMRTHPPEETLARLREQYRSNDAEADLEAIRATIPMLSREGTISAESAETVRKSLAVSVESVRTTLIDLPKTYTNDFVGVR